MLVLSRKLGEEIVIDGQIKVTVLKVQGGRVRIGIDAPESVRVLRKELRNSAAEKWHDISKIRPPEIDKKGGKIGQRKCA